MGDGQHSHCMGCRLTSCTQTVDGVNSCPMMSCGLCNFRFHECKQAEHQLTCLEERVPCLNELYGCPHIVKRSKMASHLPDCPAGVIFCTQEWSRWPMYTMEKGERAPLPPSKLYVDCGQLDVGLAMRDQRMLIDSLKAPKKLRRTLRNPLTKKYPAAPITHRGCSQESETGASADTSLTLSDDETDAPWDLTKSHPGLRESISRQLFRVTKETAADIASTLSSTTSNLSDGNPGLPNVAEVGDESEESLTVVSPGTEATVTSCAKNSMNKPSSGQLDENLETETAKAERLIRSSISSDRESDGSTRSRSVIQDVGGTQLHKILGAKVDDTSESEIHLHKILGVNLQPESMGKYVGKHPSMYTFICAQNFKRHEYRWHFKNVHQDIHQGWLEQRCPLAYLGCTYSFQRFLPGQENTSLHHSWLQESFGLKSHAMPILKKSYPQGDEPLKKQCAEEDQSAGKPQLPGISNLSIIDKQFDSLQTHRNTAVNPTSQDKDVSDFIIKSGEGNFGSGDASTPAKLSLHQDVHIEDDMACASVQPVLYTSTCSDSKVLFQYNLEEDVEQSEEETDSTLTDLPFEVLQQIVKQLDSFSMCNVALTCHFLRDVCCSLLDDHGIVLLDWKRRKTVEGNLCWKPVSKRWMFSTSFEPITSWRFNSDYVHIGDHLKTCPFNQDKQTHSGAMIPFPIV